MAAAQTVGPRALLAGHLPPVERLTGPVGAGGVYSLTRAALVPTQNRFLPLDSEGREHKREVTLADFSVNEAQEAEEGEIS